MKKVITYFWLILLTSIIGGGCDEYIMGPDTKTPAVEPPLTGQIDFLMSDNGGGYDPNSLTHRVEINKPIWFHARTNNSNIHYFTWLLGNGDTASSRDFMYTYDTPGTYTVCVTGWTSDTSYTFCDQLEVVISTSNANPVVRLQTSTAVSGGRYKLTLNFRKGSIYNYTNCGLSAPFATYNAGVDSTTWIIHNNLGNSSDTAYLKDTVTVPNYYLLKFAFGGSPGCYANMQPSTTPPQTSQYWHNDPIPANRGLWARVVNGALVAFDTVINLPGVIGDGVDHPIVRLGVSPTNPDSIVFYFNSAYITSTSGSYQWANNATGIANAQLLADLQGFAGWKMGRLHRNQIIALVGQLVQFKYGRPLSSLAAYQSSVFYNSGSLLLEIVVIDIGDSIAHKYEIQIVNKSTGQIIGKLQI